METFVYPKVSVIIPAYNRAHCIERALKSAQKQTFQNLEILVCDDASTDSTRTIVRACQKKDSRIRLLSLPKNKGAAAARNLGIQASQGEYIAFLDSDDEWLPEKLDRQVIVMENLSDQWGGIYCGSYIYKDGNTKPVIQNVSLSGNIFKHYLLGKFYAVTPSFLFRKSCFGSVGLFDENLLRGQDLDLFIRISRLYKIACIPEPLVKVHLLTNKALADVTYTSHLILIKRWEKYAQEFGWYFKRCYYANRFIKLANLYIRERRYYKATLLFLRSVGYVPLVQFSVYLNLLKSIIYSFYRPSKDRLN